MKLDRREAHLARDAHSPPLFAGASLKHRSTGMTTKLWWNSPPLFAGASLKLFARPHVARQFDDSPPLFAGASLKHHSPSLLFGVGHIPPRFSRGPH